MAVNLLETFQTYLSSDVLEQISAFIGESHEPTEMAVQAGVPALLAGLTERMSTTLGSERVMSLINQVGSRLDVGALLATASPPFDDLATLGSGLLAAIFGGNLAAIVETLAVASGLRTESALTLLSMLTSIVLGVLGREVAEHHLGTTGLASLLASQRDEINAFVPSLLGAMMTAAPATLLAPDTSPAVPAHAAPPPRTRHPLAWLVPTAAVALLAATGWCYMRPQGLEERRAAASFSPPPPPTEPAPSAATPSPAAPAPSTPVEPSAPAKPDASAKPPTPSESEPAAGGAKVADVKLPGGRSLKMEPGSGSYALNKFLATENSAAEVPKAFTFERLSFESNSTTLMDRSEHMIAELVAILKAYPSVEVRVEAHTDNHGNKERNKTLSLVRAQAVKAKLVAGGIAESRIIADGVGPDRPIANNNTSEGRRHNRRVDVVVVRR
jgi:outer membrane protein OmpA-like peptidoglycan-associated protein